jgi:zona occludens toxin
MAIYLNTGTPGAGKTLFTLWTVEQRRIADNKQLHADWVASGSDSTTPALERDVYYFNINVKNLPWIRLAKPEDWIEKPVGSLFVFDECQEAFPPRANSSTPPKYVSELAKARHQGYDLYFVTQHPTFVDPYIRKLAEEHNHLMRPYGAKRAVVHTWKGVKDNCDKSRKDSLRSSFKHPKEVYGWYKSAEVHTHKLRIPRKILMMALIPVLLGACGYGLYNYVQGKIHPTSSSTSSVLPNGRIAGSGSPSINSSPSVSVFQPASFIPVISDIPWSSPRYAALTTPTVAPRIVGCMIMRGDCKCLTQQGTYYKTSMPFCVAAVNNGIFQDFNDGGGGQSSTAGNEKKNEVAKPATPEKAAFVDSGFNLPLPSIAEKYSEKMALAPSGNIYPVPLQDSKVMLGNR